MSSEEQMNMVEILSEELGEKELKIMKLEEQLKEQKNRMKEMMKDNLYNAFHGLGYEDTPDYCEFKYIISEGDEEEWYEILTKMNNIDWNRDERRSELYIVQLRRFQDQIMYRFKSCVGCDCVDNLILCDNDLNAGQHYVCEDCIG